MAMAWALVALLAFAFGAAVDAGMAFAWTGRGPLGTAGG